MTARTQLVVQVRQSLFCKQCFIHLYPDVSSLGTFYPDEAAICMSSYSTSVRSVALSYARSVNEVADHALSMCWLAVHNHCFLTPYHVLDSFSTSTSPVYFSIFLFCLLQQSAFVPFLYMLSKYSQSK